MKKIILFLLCMGYSLSLTANAGEATADKLPGRVLPSAEIKKLLQDATALYVDGARQFFAANGHTDYKTATGGKSVGSWRVSDDKYCSTWAPGGSSCYIITRHDKSDIPVLRWNNDYEAKIYPGNLMEENGDK